MDVLQEILKWSEDKPNWQKDALRRIIQKGRLQDSDYIDLLEICKSSHGLSNHLTSESLIEAHLPKKIELSESVILKSLTHYSGVNALAKNQTIKFGNGLTIVYGQNAAGKSGYTRVLKTACRARGSEEVLSNVLSDNLPDKPNVTLEYQVGDAKNKWKWEDTKKEDSELGHVSVFDRHCATVYLDERTDVAFRPFGLDLFDKLSTCCEKLKVTLDKERSTLEKIVYQTNISTATKAHKLIVQITSLTSIDEIKEYAKLSSVEKKRQLELKKQLSDLQSVDIGKTKKSLALKLERIKTLKEKLQQIEGSFSVINTGSIKEIQNDVIVKEGVVKALKTKIEKFGILTGTGSKVWSKMWMASEEFSKLAYPKNEFPFTEDDAHCLLCQQELQEVSKERLIAFGKFMSSSTQNDLAELRNGLEIKISLFKDLKVKELASSDILAELEIDYPELVKELKQEIEHCNNQVETFVSHITESKTIEYTKFKIQGLEELCEIEKTISERLKSLSIEVKKEDQLKLENELIELNAKEELFKEVPSIKDEIERKKKIAAFGLCLNDVGTAAITRKSTEVTKKTVTDQLCNSFQLELNKLGFNHLEVELRASGGTRGTLYHKLVIKRAASIRVQNVVSEGEARALSIAAFFSELSTSTNTSAILFDDPVSSLDHVWREKVALRLVTESRTRQVVVFTHDVVFLNVLKKLSDDMKVDCLHQYIHREFQGAGVASDDLPWVAMRVKERIGVLKKMWQEAEKIERTISKDEYAPKAIQMYGYLREAWERGLEEILINGVVERYRPGVQTKQIKSLADITQNDCDTFFDAMAKCSRWLPGHDNAPAENAPVPDSLELKNDIVILEEWSKTIIGRRKN